MVDFKLLFATSVIGSFVLNVKYLTQEARFTWPSQSLALCCQWGLLCTLPSNWTGTPSACDPCVHGWDMWAMCARLRQTPWPPQSLTRLWERISESVTGAAAPCSLLSERGKKKRREMERVTSLRPGLSQRDDWKADVTVWANERGRKKRMSSFIFRVRVEKARADSIDDVYSWGVNDLGWWGCERSSSQPDWVQTVCWHSGLNKQKESCFCHIVITPGTH